MPPVKRLWLKCQRFDLDHCCSRQGGTRSHGARSVTAECLPWETPPRLDMLRRSNSIPTVFRPWRSSTARMCGLHRPRPMDESTAVTTRICCISMSGVSPYEQVIRRPQKGQWQQVKFPGVAFAWQSLDEPGCPRSLPKAPSSRAKTHLRLSKVANHD